MYDVTAGHEGCHLVSGDVLDACQVVGAAEVDRVLEPYGDDQLTDAELLEHAWFELVAADVPVLGSAGEGFPAAQSVPVVGVAA